VTRTDPDRYCTQHHQPRSQCRPGDRHVRAMRFRDDDWETAEQAAWTAKSDVTSVATLAVTAMSDYIRCYRCGAPVPAEMGDLTGTTLREALFAAEKHVAGQHPRHEPVMVGAETPAVAAAPPGSVPFKSAVKR
jgi:hypothetical protein